ncbi:hypothetical protein DERP_008831 [Dermatophagoides pteronyssinus]|uniref:Uncharacterized protein n=1 Tax=Dermatophagoides pteronyssinus TaxID=6956 RepID=A0ABQ8IWF2_DERPT|nr:hypothetical protein DERP_008831 [Dermatophagoides pteronyssinus]
MIMKTFKKKIKQNQFIKQLSSLAVNDLIKKDKITLNSHHCQFFFDPKNSRELGLSRNPD